MPSAHVAARNVDVWLPPGYGQDPQKRYPVLYMLHGQGYNDDQWDRLGINEAVTTLLLNYLAIDLMLYLIYDSWKDPLGSGHPASPQLAVPARLPLVGDLLVCNTYEGVCTAIAGMAVRGGQPGQHGTGQYL